MSFWCKDFLYSDAFDILFFHKDWIYPLSLINMSFQVMFLLGGGQCKIRKYFMSNFKNESKLSLLTKTSLVFLLVKADTCKSRTIQIPVVYGWVSVLISWYLNILNIIPAYNFNHLSLPIWDSRKKSLCLGLNQLIPQRPLW